MQDENIYLENIKNSYPLLEIDSRALNHNVALLRKIAGTKTRILVPVKANAYGCGLGEIIKFLEANPPDYIGVANPFEAVEARRYGWTGNILNLGGFFPQMADIFFQYQIMPTITDLWQIETLNKLASEKKTKINVHLKLDLGMGRIGLTTGEINSAVDILRGAENIHISGIFTHFPSSDIPESGSNNIILNKFHDRSGFIIDSLNLRRNEIILHSANSYAVMLNPDSHLDMIRPGLCFYGYFANSADRKNLSKEFPFRPSLKLKAFPVSIRRFTRGSTISYGETFTVAADKLSAGVIPLGYADGIPRAISNKISFNGFPLLGRVTMDQIVVGGLTNLNQEIELLGDNCPPLEHWADIASTISYEIMVRLGDRIQRKLV